MHETINLANLGQIGILGITASLIMEWIKSKWGPTSTTSKFIIIALSLVLGTIYVLIKDTQFFITVLAILAAASLIYAFFMK